MNNGTETAPIGTANVTDGAAQTGEDGKPIVTGAGAEGSTTGDDGKPADDAATGAEGKPDGEGGEGDPPDPGSDDAPEGAPESYADFTLPEGLELEPEATSAFKEAAKADNLSQAQAQKYVDMASGLVDRTLKGFQTQGQQRIEQWAEQLKTDPEVGGREYEAKVQIALNAVGQFGDEELKQTFTEYGLGNNPAIVRAFYRIGKAMSESGFVHGQGNEQPAKPGNREQALAQRMEQEQARSKAK